MPRVINVVEYNRIYQDVRPLVNRKAEAEEEASKKESELLVKSKFKEVTDKVEALESELRQAITTKEKVEAEAEECTKKLELAQRLVNGLGGEKKRWCENVAKFKEDEKTIVGDSLLAASFVSYIGPFSSMLRLNLWQETWLPTEQMEATINSLVLERVSGKWVELAYPSCRSLISWLLNLQSRVEQLSG